MSGPHDLFARFTFENPERAAAELRAVLPSEVAARVDWSSLRRESGSVVDPQLRETQSDLLFSARLHEGQPLLLYFLLEHQSKVDRWMALRMLRYVVRLWERWRRQNSKSEALPLVIPVVMYHGPEGGWTAVRRVEELVPLPRAAQDPWRALVPRFEYLVDDLTSEREEVLRARPGPPLVALSLLLLRSGRSENLAVLLEGWRSLLAAVLASPEGEEQLRAIIHYLLRVGVEAADEALRRVLNSVTSEQRAEELMRTMAEALIEKGHAKGLQEGRAKGLQEGRATGLQEGLTRGRAQERAEAVLRILASRGIAMGDTERQLIQSCTDLDTLDRWFDRALSAHRFSDLLENG